MKKKNISTVACNTDEHENILPISLEKQKALLDLINRRKSGIISREELKDLLFPDQQSTLFH